MLLGARFTGTLLRRIADGREIPAVDASISIASEPCPRGKPHPLPLDSAGRFDEKYDLETDTHLFCRAGKVETQRRILPIRLRVVSQGCESVEIEFSGEPGPYALELACNPPEASPLSTGAEHDTRAPIGAKVDLSDGLLLVNDTSVTLPVAISQLEQLLGPPSRVARAAGDQYSNDVYEWEADGIFGFARPGGATAHALGLLLSPDHNDRHWCNPGTVRLTVNDVDLTRSSRSSQIRKAGFRKVDGDFEIRFDGFYATLIALGDPPDYYELEVGTE